VPDDGVASVAPGGTITWSATTTFDARYGVTRIPAVPALHYGMPPNVHAEVVIPNDSPGGGERLL
jgi:hypothetical protein